MPRDASSCYVCVGVGAACVSHPYGQYLKPLRRHRAVRLLKRGLSRYCAMLYACTYVQNATATTLFSCNFSRRLSVLALGFAEQLGVSCFRKRCSCFRAVSIYLFDQYRVVVFDMNLSTCSNTQHSLQGRVSRWVLDCFKALKATFVFVKLCELQYRHL